MFADVREGASVEDQKFNNAYCPRRLAGDTRPFPLST